MPPQISAELLSPTLKPACTRDNHLMHYEAKGITWPEDPEGSSVHAVSSYHCNYFGCSVRYTHTDGYVTVVDTPERPHFVDEPGANLLQCPRHGTWLYRIKDESATIRSSVWHCGVEGCDYVNEVGSS